MWVDGIKENTDKSQTKNVDSSIDNFLQSIKKNKNEIETFLQSSENQELKNKLENFLSTEDKSKVNVLKVKLMTCKPEDIGSIIASYVWYKIWTREIIKSTEILNEVYSNTEQADQDTEQADQDTEQREKQALREEVMNARINLLASHPDQEKAKKIDEKTRERAKLVKQQLQEEIKNQLEEKGYDEKFINDYMLLRVTANEVKNDSSFDKNVVAQFESKVNELGTLDVILKNIDNACKTPDTSLDSFSSKNISQTRAELFHETVWNKDLIWIRDNNKEVRKYPEWFFDMGEDEIIAQYGKFLPNEYKRLLDDYARQYEQNNLDEYKNSKDYKTLSDAVNSIKEKVDNDTKNMMEELCIISQIKWMYMCMWEWTDFNLNKSREIRFDDEGAMILDGHIDGMDFAIRQDINDPEAKLQTSQKIARDGNAFVVGWKDKFVDSNFGLPSQNEIFESITKIIQSDSILPLDNFDSPDDYLENLQTNIMWTMEKKYKDTELVHHYMKQQVKWEKLVNKALWFIDSINPSITNNEALMNNISKENNKDLYAFMKVLKFNIDNSTDVEKDHLDWCIDEIGRIIDNYRTKGKSSVLYSDKISKYLENDIWVNWNQDDELKLIFGLFNNFNENPINDSRSGFKWSDWIPSNMIINDLYIQLHDKPKEKQQQQERDDIAYNEAQNAERNLDSELELLSMA